MKRCSQHSALSTQHCLGVTLLEMLVVLALMGLMAAVVAPSVGAGLETVRLRTSAERLAASLKLARDRAVRTRHYVEVTLDPATHRVTIQDLEGDYQRGWELPETIVVKEEANSLPAPSSASPIRASALALQAVEASREHLLAFLFPPDGAPPAVALRLENNRGRAVDVEMDPLTAFATVLDPARKQP